MSERTRKHGKLQTGQPVQLALPLEFVPHPQSKAELRDVFFNDPELPHLELMSDRERAMVSGRYLDVSSIPLEQVFNAAGFNPQTVHLLRELEGALNRGLESDSPEYKTAVGYLYSLYQSGASLPFLGEAFDVSWLTIRKIFNAARLPIRTRNEAIALLPSNFKEDRVDAANLSMGRMIWHDKTQEELALWLELHPEFINRSFSQLILQSGTEGFKFAAAVKRAARKAHPNDFEARLHYVHDIIPASARKVAIRSFFVWEDRRIIAPSRDQAIAASILLRTGIMSPLIRGEYKRRDYKYHPENPDPANYEVYTEPGAQFNLDFYLPENIFIEYHPLSIEETLLGYSIEQVQGIRESHIQDKQYKGAQLILIEKLDELKVVIDRIQQLRTGREYFGGEGDEAFTLLKNQVMKDVKPILKKTT